MTDAEEGTTGDERRSESGGDAVIVVLHFGDGAATVALDAETGSTDLLTGESVDEAGDVRVDSVAVVSAGGDRARR